MSPYRRLDAREGAHEPAGAVQSRDLDACFWGRLLFYELAVINAMILAKVAWSFYYGGESGWILLPPTLLGVGSCSVVILYVAHQTREKARA